MAFSSSTTARLCGGHLIVEFAARAAADCPDRYVVALTPRHMLWDGEEVSPVVAEALATAWFAAQGDD